MFPGFKELASVYIFNLTLLNVGFHIKLITSGSKMVDIDCDEYCDKPPKSPLMK